MAIQEKGGNKKLWIHAELENGTNCRQHQEESSTMSTKRINNGPLRRRPFIQILDNRLHIYEIYISSADNSFCHLCNIDTFISLLREIYDIFTTLKQATLH